MKARKWAFVSVAAILLFVSSPALAGVLSCPVGGFFRNDVLDPAPSVGILSNVASTCGSFGWGVGFFELSVFAPSHRSAPSILEFLGQSTWNPYVEIDEASFASGSGSLAIWHFTPEFLGSGGPFELGYEMDAGDETAFYGEFGLAFCYEGPCNEMGSWEFSPLAGSTTTTEGFWSGVIPGGAMDGGFYELVLTGSTDDPFVRIGDPDIFGPGRPAGVEPIPEPATGWLLAGGLAAAALWRRRSQ